MNTQDDISEMRPSVSSILLNLAGILGGSALISTAFSYLSFDGPAPSRIIFLNTLVLVFSFGLPLLVFEVTPKPSSSVLRILIGTGLGVLLWILTTTLVDILIDLEFVRKHPEDAWFRHGFGLVIAAATAPFVGTAVLICVITLRGAAAWFRTAVLRRL